MHFCQRDSSELIPTRKKSTSRLSNQFLNSLMRSSSVSKAMPPKWRFKGRVFKVEILEPPCNILQYVIPNLVHWTLPVSLHDRIGKSSRDAKVINKVDSVPFYNSIHSLNFTEMLVARYAKYTYFKANLYYSEGLLKMKFIRINFRGCPI
ncbi:hypothetical protein PoB_001035700 [Plakobranchus ocellatus]|uniref:Uncharacterized protein n=1 Tax=Plakobranchus ocellatus TaxID=259542 RepID=A0AAV3YLP4_9GAST|nr:hypothetical protein PoB_001035700 [Plakobranchus ocellatus]